MYKLQGDKIQQIKICLCCFMCCIYNSENNVWYKVGAQQILVGKWIQFIAGKFFARTSLFINPFPAQGHLHVKIMTLKGISTFLTSFLSLYIYLSYLHIKSYFHYLNLKQLWSNAYFITCSMRTYEGGKKLFFELNLIFLYVHIYSASPSF
jgi:hypothetical protein